jgi:hypothetical protein
MMKSSTYPLLDGLLDLACRDGVDIRPTLLRVLTDLFVQKRTHSADEEAQYIELAMGLIEAVDAPTRAAVITSLSTYPDAPAVILRKLTGSDVPLSPATSSRKQAETENLVELFFAARTEERRLILGNLDAAAKTPARRPASTSSEVIRRLETAALQHNTGEFSRTLERALGISHALAARIARDHSGEPVVIAAKALGMTAAVLQRILLFLNPAIGQSVERVHDLARLFDELKPEAAEGIVAIWRKTGVGSKPVQKSAYEPAHGDDEHRRARSLASPAQHRVFRDRNENLGRAKSGER